jgi:glycosyltransferase involved in cell wall biosynthesis
MRVVHLTSAHPPDDPRIFVKECRTLARAGYDVHLVAPQAGDDVRDGVRRWGLAARPGSNRLVRMSWTVLLAYRRARSLRAGLYHFHDPELIPIALLLARAGTPVVYDAHEDLAADILDKPWIARRLRRPLARAVGLFERAAAARFAAVVAATPAIAERFANGRGRVVTVNNFAEPGEFADLAPGAADRERAVCFVGNISEIRGIETMVRAIARTDARIVLAGRFAPADLPERLQGLPGWSQVVVRGQVGRPEVVEIMARAMAGVVLFQPLANHVRSQPTKLFEYMAAGLPVIASDFPRWREIVEGSACGLCVDPEDPVAVADAIRWIVDHPQAARKMGENGRRAALTTYTWTTEAAKLTSLYASLLGT